MYSDGLGIFIYTFFLLAILIFVPSDSAVTGTVVGAEVSTWMVSTAPSVTRVLGFRPTVLLGIELHTFLLSCFIF